MPENKGLETYLQSGINKVRGWCDPFLWQVIEPLSVEVKKRAPDAPIAEIGVYHGKFFIGLVKTMDVGSLNCAFDVFDMQEFNKDKAGVGDQEIFLSNCIENGISKEQISMEKTDSTWLRSPDRYNLIEKYGRFSMFSVDGCHTEHHTMRDIELAMDLTHPAGLIFVDDYYNDFWPGVHEGVCKLFQTQSPPFVPLAFLCNKLILCSISYHDDYLRLIHSFVRDRHPTSKWKLSPRYGYSSLSVRPDAKNGKPLLSLYG